MSYSSETGSLTSPREHVVARELVVALSILLPMDLGLQVNMGYGQAHIYIFFNIVEWHPNSGPPAYVAVTFPPPF